MSWFRPRLIQLLPLAAIMLALSSSAPPATAAGGPCGSGLVANYRAPLEALPPQRAVPITQKVSFGPAGFYLSTIGTTLPTGPETVGYRLSYSSKHGGPSPRLDWKVEARLLRVGRKDAKGSLVEKKHIEISRISGSQGRSLTFRLAAKPSIYAVRISFRRARDKSLLGSFGEYIRVLSFDQAAQLTLGAVSFRPGETVIGCLANVGTVPLVRGFAHLEAFDGASWVPVVVPPQYAIPMTDDLRIIGAGETEAVYSPLPPESAPGLYRLAWTGQARTGGGPSAQGESPPTEVTAEFEVPATY